MTTRRALLAASLAAAAGCAAGPAPAPAFAALEARTRGGRLGIAAIDGAGRAIGWRADERFAMCSTFKLPLAALVLRETAAGRLDPGEAPAYAAADFVPHRPVTGPALAEGRRLSVIDLAEAAQITSDNVAANLLIRRLGGPEAVTAAWRAMGDPTSRLDRYEPEMNLVAPGEVRDTTTPAAMAAFALRLAAGDALPAAERARLVGWMRDTKTGLNRIRAGLPEAWAAGDKTGTLLTDDRGAYNDVAVAWPPGRAPLAIAVYYACPRGGERVDPAEEAILAEAGRLVAAWAQG